MRILERCRRLLPCLIYALAVFSVLSLVLIAIPATASAGDACRDLVAELKSKISDRYDGGETPIAAYHKDFISFVILETPLFTSKPYIDSIKQALKQKYQRHNDPSDTVYNMPRTPLTVEEEILLAKNIWSHLSERYNKIDGTPSNSVDLNKIDDISTANAVTRYAESMGFSGLTQFMQMRQVVELINGDAELKRLAERIVRLSMYETDRRNEVKIKNEKHKVKLVTSLHADIDLEDSKQASAQKAKVDSSNLKISDPDEKGEFLISRETTLGLTPLESGYLSAHEILTEEYPILFNYAYFKIAGKALSQAKMNLEAAAKDAAAYPEGLKRDISETILAGLNEDYLTELSVDAISSDDILKDRIKRAASDLELSENIFLKNRSMIKAINENEAVKEAALKMMQSQLQPTIELAIEVERIEGIRAELNIIKAKTGKKRLAVTAGVYGALGLIGGHYLMDVISTDVPMTLLTMGAGIVLPTASTIGVGLAPRFFKKSNRETKIQKLHDGIAYKIQGIKEATDANKKERATGEGDL